MQIRLALASWAGVILTAPVPSVMSTVSGSQMMGSRRPSTGWIRNLPCKCLYLREKHRPRQLRPRAATSLARSVKRQRHSWMHPKAFITLNAASCSVPSSITLTFKHAF